MDDRYTESKTKSLTPYLWIACVLLVLGLIFSHILWPDKLWIPVTLSLLLVGDLGFLIYENRKAMSSRTASFGINSIMIVLLVVSIVGVINFLSYRYPYKHDFTENQIHTLSDQTSKFVKGLKKDVKATVFAKMDQKEKYRPILENYKGMNPKFIVEYVDPDKEPTRAKQIGIKKYGTVYLEAGERNTKIDDLTEEKLTNALIKLVKDKKQTLCAITGHGENDVSDNGAEGYSTTKKNLEDQAYEIKSIDLPSQNGIPEDCDAIAILGPKKSFFEPEVKALDDFLASGGRAIIALDINIKGDSTSPELYPILEKWHIGVKKALIVDPISRMLGVDASTPIVPTYSKDHSITKDFKEQSYFPFTRPLEIKEGSPTGLDVKWLAKTTPKSWAETNMKELATGKVGFNAGSDTMGPITVAVSAEGKLKDSKAKKSTRLVVFGTSLFASNNGSRFGGNLDFFLNSASWIMEDESLISIRAKESGPGKVELSQQTGQIVFWISVVLAPAFIALGGVVNWWRRRKL